MNIIQEIEKEQIEKLTAEKSIPEFSPGDTIRVNVKVSEGSRSRLQAFEGMCIARKNDGLHSSFTVRKLSYGEGVERVFPLYFSSLQSIGLSRQPPPKPNQLPNQPEEESPSLDSLGPLDDELLGETQFISFPSSSLDEIFLNVCLLVPRYLSN